MCQYAEWPVAIALCVYYVCMYVIVCYAQVPDMCILSVLCSVCVYEQTCVRVYLYVCVCVS